MATDIKSKQTFLWQGTDRRGNKSRGEIDGVSQALVKAQLRKQGINPTKVKKKPKPLFGGGKKKITPLDIAFFTRQLATMIKSGVPLVQAFEIVADGLDHIAFKELVLTIRNDIAGGDSFAGAIRKHPLYFDDLYCSLIASGEDSGSLETMLDRVATYKEKTEALKSKLKKAMKYPIAVVTVAVIVTGILLVKVVPQFQEIFTSFGAQLPAFTLFVIGLSEIVQAYWFIVLAVIFALVAGFNRLMKTSESFRHNFERLTLKLPVAGPIIQQSALARYARTLSTTFAAGVPLISALESVADATGNIVYKEAVLKVRDDVSTGQQLQFSMRATGVFPAMAVQMVAIGEEAGSLDEMLDKVATYYEDEVDTQVDSLTSLMEPIIMSVLGVLVGGLVMAMYLPIFQLGNVV
ncbi:MAG: type II secretion system F family protein [Pseudomonadales bacterium]|jgi:type IV pilus assembly protein PilC|nr:type II secretion system F family protein [Pseudomonadales bacterium]MCC6529992.1 type II secretion system F family protein [Pseudomonadales bacterium]MCP5332187.1 type II secretion system F family protein [Pseudomonadales bacterium]HMU90375.1 type II secretion system F family protein [Pseudomonadales bacterium]HMW14999.1 type II secretion system F family protein [Pseudomonadales bacterium]